MDTWTLLAVSTIMVGCLSALVAALWLFNRRLPGLMAWSISFALAFALSLNYTLRAHLPPLLATVSVLVLSIGSAFYTLMGSRQYLGLPVWGHRRALALMALLAVAALMFEWQQPPVFWRVVLMSVTGAGLYLASAWVMARGALREYPVRHLFGWICAVHAIFLLLRPVAVRLGAPSPQDVSVMMSQARPLIIEAMVAVLLMSMAIFMLATEYVNAELRRMAYRDPLTDVFNRRAFLDLLQRSTSLARRRGAVVPLLLADLDHFKSINDTHGHQQGDRVLCHFVAVAQSVLRTEDVIGRIGGEEFAIFLPSTTLREAQDVAERLRRAVESAPVAGSAQAPVGLTVSIGVAHCEQVGDLEQALRQADLAMYEAKRLGRNRVCMAAAAAEAAAASPLPSAAAA